MANLSDLIAKVNQRREAGSARLVGEEAEKAREALAERDFAKRLAEQAAKDPGAEPEPPSDLRRSTMDAKSKSEYIRARGLAKYQALPD